MSSQGTNTDEEEEEEVERRGFRDPASRHPATTQPDRSQRPTHESATASNRAPATTVQNSAAWPGVAPASKQHPSGHDGIAATDPSFEAAVLFSVYICHRNKDVYIRAGNVRFYLQRGVLPFCPEKSRVLTVFVVQREDDDGADEALTSLGLLGDSSEANQRRDVVVLQRKNQGYDFGAFAEGLRFLSSSAPGGLRRFQHLMFLNDGVRGPFVPPCFPFGTHWTEAFFSRLRGRPDVGVVGSSLVVLPPPPKDPDGPGPRVEGFCFATRPEQVLWMIRDGVFRDFETKTSAILEGEYGVSKSVLRRGFRLDCLVEAGQDVSDWNDPRNADWNDNLHPSRENSCFGASMHPFETMFHKTAWTDRKTGSVSLVNENAWKRLTVLRKRGGGVFRPAFLPENLP